MAKVFIQAADLKRGTQEPLKLPTGEAHTIVVQRSQGTLIEMEDLNFHFDSAVLLPDHRDDDGATSPEQDLVTGLSVLRACYLYADANPDFKIVIAGHTDTVGPPDYNLTLSQRRADGVLYALLGKRDEWAKLANEKHQVSDYQHILTWIAEAFVFDCNPEGIDNKSGPKTKAAVLHFQERYNQEYGKHIGEDGVVGVETWGAFFDLYMIKLAELMETDVAGLDAYRKKLAFVDDNKRAVGCGENHPIEDAGIDERRSEVNRRVEILFFEPGFEPKVSCHPDNTSCLPELCEIYDTDLYQFEYIPVDELSNKLVLVLEWPDEYTQGLPEDLALRLTADGSALADQAWTDGELVDERRRFVFGPVDKGSSLTLEAVTADGNVTLFEDQSFDDPDTPPVWQTTLADLVVEDSEEGADEPAEELPAETEEHVAPVPT
jgi:outer membrane protein OmpA-like peptidoglycan-associated protein